MMSGEPGYSRRTFIGTAGAAAGTLALAGCTQQSDDSSGGGGDNSGSDGSSGDDSSSDDSSSDATETSTELSGEISITGSSTVFPLATAVAEQFQRDNG